MNFTILSRNSTAGTVYTDRPSYQGCYIPQPWKTPHIEHLHLNPSKSKVNVRNSLNKSGENFSLSNPNLDNIRASCIVGNPPKPNQHISRQSLFDDKFKKNGKENTDISFESNSQDNFIKFNNMNRTTLFQPQERKRCDSSSYLRSSVKDPILPKFDDQVVKSKQDKNFEDLRASILALNKRMFLNQQQVSKLKEKKQKDKKIQTLEHQFTQFQIQMFDICKKNTNYFSEFEDKIEKNVRSINDIKQRLIYNNERDQEREDFNRKIHRCQVLITDLQEKIKSIDDSNVRNVQNSPKLYSNFKSYINEYFNELKTRLDNQAIESNQILAKIHQIEKNREYNKIEEQYFKKEGRVCNNPIIVERKETITVKETPIKEKIRNIGTPSSPIKDVKDCVMEPRRQIIIKQNLYYIDSQGFLLDENKYYLLNSRNQHILIAQNILHCLKQNNILVTQKP